MPLAIGKDLGIFSKHGVDVDVTTFSGSAELEKALEKGTIEIALGSGTEFAFIPNGAPDTSVAALAVRPGLLVVSARPDADIKAVDDLYALRTPHVAFFLAIHPKHRVLNLWDAVMSLRSLNIWLVDMEHTVE